MRASRSCGGGRSRSIHLLMLGGYGSEVILGTGSVTRPFYDVQMRRGGGTQSDSAGGVVSGVDVSRVAEGGVDDSKTPEQLVSDTMRTHFLKPNPGVVVPVRQEVLDECIDEVETAFWDYWGTVRRDRNGPGPEALSDYVALRHGRLAGVLYDRLDRTRMLALLEECEKRTGRPAGVTNQWFLAMLLGARLRRGSCISWMEKLNVVPDAAAFSKVRLYGNQVGPHFVGLPAMSAEEIYKLDVISSLFNLFLKTKRGPKMFLSLDRRVRAASFDVINTFGIELAASLHRTLGKEWFGQVVRVARQLFDRPESRWLSDPCFLGCFLRLYNAYIHRSCMMFCRGQGLPVQDWQTRDHLDPLSEGLDFFGRLPGLNFQPPPAVPGPVSPSAASTLLEAPFTAPSVTVSPTSAPSRTPEVEVCIRPAPSTAILASFAYQEAFDFGVSHDVGSQASGRQELPGKNELDLGPVSVCRLAQDDESTYGKRRRLTTAAVARFANPPRPESATDESTTGGKRGNGHSIRRELSYQKAPIVEPLLNDDALWYVQNFSFS